jgi:hypothetical protein
VVERSTRPGEDSDPVGLEQRPPGVIQVQAPAPLVQVRGDAGGVKRWSLSRIGPLIPVGGACGRVVDGQENTQQDGMLVAARSEKELMCPGQGLADSRVLGRAAGEYGNPRGGVQPEGRHGQQPLPFATADGSPARSTSK